MSVKSRLFKDEMLREILCFCKKESLPFSVVAVAAHGKFIEEMLEKINRLNILVITNSSKMTLKYHTKSFDDIRVSFLIVDKKTLKRDVDNDWMGGILVEIMLMPYEPLINKEYLWKHEICAKKRLITEILANLILEYPETCRELMVEPRFFMLEAIARKASLYPPIKYRFMKILQGTFSPKAQELRNES